MKEKKIVFRCVGGPSIGWGHVVRSLNLAAWLKGKYKIYFVINQDPQVSSFIKHRGFPVFEIAERATDEKYTEKVINTVLSFEPHMVINDMQDSSPEYMQAIKSRNIKIVSFDDTSPSAKYAHVLIDANRKEKAGKMFGLQYIVLNSQYAKMSPKKRKIRKKVRSIVMSFGGSDPAGITEKAVAALADRLPQDIMLTVVQGPGYARGGETLARWRERSNITVCTQVRALGSLFLEADIAIVSGGLTMCEALALGTPTLVIGQNKAQAKNARRMERCGAIDYLGEGDRVSQKKISRKVETLIQTVAARQALSDKSRKVVDARGIFRVLEQIELCC